MRQLSERWEEVMSSLSKQRLLRAANGHKATVSLRRVTNSGGELSPSGHSVCPPAFKTGPVPFHFFPLLLLFFLSISSCNLQIQTPEVLKNASFSTGRLFLVGPVSNCHDCFWFLGNELLKITNHLVTTKSHLSVLIQSNSTFVSRGMLCLTTLGEENTAEQDE